MEILLRVDVDSDEDHRAEIEEHLCEAVESNCDEHFTVGEDNYCDCDHCGGHEEEIHLYVRSAVVVTRRELITEDHPRPGLIGSSVL